MLRTLVFIFFLLTPTIALCDENTMGVCINYVGSVCSEFVPVTNIETSAASLDYDLAKVIGGKCLTAWAVGVCVGAIANMIKKGR